MTLQLRRKLPTTARKTPWGTTPLRLLAGLCVFALPGVFPGSAQAQTEPPPLLRWQARDARPIKPTSASPAASATLVQPVAHQQPFEPARPTASFARHQANGGNTAGGNESLVLSEQGQVLRWRRSGSSGRERIVVQPVSYPTLTAPQSNATPVEGIRLAQQDAFQDPFGERSDPPTTPAPGLPAPGLPAPGLPAPGDTDPAPSNPFRPDEGLPAPDRRSDDSDDAPPRLPGRLRPAPATPTPDEDCDRIYNDRNCCDDERNCKHVRQLVHSQTIANISLDITPHFKPDAERYQQAILRESKLAKMESRTWRSRQGRVLTEGRLADFRNGTVIVLGEDEQTYRLPFRALSDDDVCFVAAHWSIPSECTLGHEPFVDRNWEALTMTWKASALCHKPLYFEQVQVERYGHSAGPILQPVISSAHFFANVAVLPYQMGIHPPHECQYALGYYRPGNCAPWMIPPVPISLRGAATQAGVLAVLLPVIP